MNSDIKQPDMPAKSRWKHAALRRIAGGIAIVFASCLLLSWYVSAGVDDGRIWFYIKRDYIPSVRRSELPAVTTQSLEDFIRKDMGRYPYARDMYLREITWRDVRLSCIRTQAGYDAVVRFNGAFGSTRVLHIK